MIGRWSLINSSIRRTGLCGTAMTALLATSAYGVEVEAVKTEPSLRNLSADVSLQLSSSTANDDEADYILDSSSELNLAYRLPSKIRLDFRAVGIKQLNREQLWILSESSVGASRAFNISDMLRLTAGLSYGLPVNKEAIRYDNSQGSFGGRMQLQVSQIEPSSGLKINLGLGTRRFFYQYLDNDGGGILRQWSVSSSLGASYRYQRLSLSVGYSNVTAWDFNGEQLNDTYVLEEKLTYRVGEDDGTTVFVGHTNDGNTFDYLGAGNNVQLYDKYTSQVFVGFGYTIL